MESRVVEAQLSLERPGHGGGIAGVGVGVGGPDGDVAVSVLPAEVLVEEGVGHEPVDPRKAFVRQGEFADPRRAPVHPELFDGERLAGLGADFNGDPLDESQAHPLDVVAAPVRGEVGVVGSLGAAPVRGDEEFEAGDVVPRDPRPFPLGPRRDPEIAIRGLDMEEGRLQASQPLLDGGCLLTGWSPIWRPDLSGRDNRPG